MTGEKADEYDQTAEIILTKHPGVELRRYEELRERVSSHLGFYVLGMRAQGRQGGAE